MCAQAGFSPSSYEQKVRSLKREAAGESSRLSDFRARAFKRFETLGFPDRHWESWKYLSLQTLLGAEFRTPEVSLKKDWPASFFDGARSRAVFVNGYLRSDLSQNLPKEIVFSKLSEISEDLPYGIDNAALEKEENPFALINAFSFCDGVLIRVPKGTSVEEPLHLLFLQDTSFSTATNPRLVLEAEEGSSLSVACHFYGGRDSVEIFENVYVEIHAAEDSRINWVNAQVREDEKGTLFFNGRTMLKKNAQIETVTFSRGRAVTRSEWTADLEGKGASFKAAGLSVLSGKSRVFNEIIARHRTEETVSRQFFKNLLDGSSQAEFNSLAHVFPGANKSDSSQLNKNLLLSDDARAYSRPKLKIETDDVQANHGSANGQSETQELFYLRSRGLDARTARFVLAYGFAEEILTHIPEKELREQLETGVRAALETMIRE